MMIARAGILKCTPAFSHAAVPGFSCRQNRASLLIKSAGRQMKPVQQKRGHGLPLQMLNSTVKF